MMNFGALNWFGFFMKKLKKALDCITHVIYTCHTLEISFVVHVMWFSSMKVVMLQAVN